MSGVLVAMHQEYPHLGFNPVPGVPADVASVTAALTQATSSLKESGALLGQVEQAGSELWQGQAADAFRGHVDSELTKRLQTAQTSLEAAVTVLTDWHGDLVGFKDTAAQLDAEAASAQAKVQQANAELKQAEANPNLSLVGREYANRQMLEEAQAEYDAAQQALSQATSSVNNAEEELQSILKRAQELSSEHQALCHRYAQQLEHAAHDLAPHKPGMFSQMWNGFTSGLSAVGHWVSSHLDLIHTILSDISAVAGLIALCTPPPIDVVAGAIALTAGAGALATDLANPKTRDAIGGLLTGHFTKQNLEAGLSVATDVISVIPGIGAAARITKGAKGLEEGVKLSSKFSDIAHDAIQTASFTGKQMAKNPLVQKVAAKVTTDSAELFATKVNQGKKAVTEIYKTITGSGDSSNNSQGATA
ncbi:putative T7SS-secreted protein [Streptacidiphilus fuscans]|uniref:Putative T7SS secretion signal domain-containing protein n=1 Tax=Streptacidiphilus fuscans TaxID=2789292 RepID=A0A931FG97_9ACTN|nr:hypothetical protein [Streptacidiphilus fuscans]MBF9072408.1 hypothetical protein [Streptacidiphilus fuscans]